MKTKNITLKVNSKLNKKEIINKIQIHKEDISRFDAKRIGLFGSFATGNQHKKSDIDLLVKFQNKTFDNYMDLKFYLEKLLRKKVDLVIEENLKPELRGVKNEAKYIKIL